MDDGYLVTVDRSSSRSAAAGWTRPMFPSLESSAGLRDFTVLWSSIDEQGADTHCYDIQFASEGRMDYSEQGMLTLNLVEGAHTIVPHGDWSPLPPGRLRKCAAVVGPGFPGSQAWQGPWRTFAIGVSPALINDVLPRSVSRESVFGGWCYTLPSADRQFVLAMEAVREDLWMRCPTGSLFRDSVTRGLLHYFFSRYGNLTPRLESEKGGLSPAELRRICNFIDENIASRMSLADLAGEAGMSPWHFSKLFKRSKGIPPHQYVLMRRIEIAKERLTRMPRRSMCDLAMDLGFSDQSTFSSVFRRYTGMTPTEYLKRR